MKTIRQLMLKPWLYLIIIFLGIALKFYRLDYRFFWYDETSTIQHASGNQIFHVPVNEIKNRSFYIDQLHLRKQNLTMTSELKGLFSSTNLTPMHYPFLMIWYRIVGDDPIHYRLFSVFIFILTLPVLFFLIKILSDSNLAAWIGTSLFSVLPVIHFCAQHARFFILWIFFICLSHYLFLMAVRKNNLQWWIAYTITGILSLYTAVFSGLILVGHLAYIAFLKRKLCLTYVISMFIILLFYSPWIYSMLINRDEIIASLWWHSHFNVDHKYWKLILCQFASYTWTFVSMYVGQSLEIIANYKISGNYAVFFSETAILLLIFYSIVYGIRKLPKDVSFFLILMLLPEFLFFYISDIIRNTNSSIIWKYQLVIYVAILLFMVFFLHKKIIQQNLYVSAIYLVFIIAGVIISIKDSGKKCYFSGLNCNTSFIEAEVFSKAQKPLLISDFSFWYGNINAFMPIINEYESDNIYVLYASPDIENVEVMLTNKDYSDIYVIHASNELVKNLKSQFGERMDSLAIEGTSPMLQIYLSKNNYINH